MKSINLLLLLLGTSFILQGQTDDYSKTIKIEFLQSLNKLETALQNDPGETIVYKEKIVKLMSREIDKNKSLTEKIMQMRDRSSEQRNQLQEQLSKTAKQKYLKRAFSEMSWETEELDSKIALEVVRNFMKTTE